MPYGQSGRKGIDVPCWCCQRGAVNARLYVLPKLLRRQSEEVSVY
nr:MAG TPA: Virulence determinant [Caudoviricetes sp.]